MTANHGVPRSPLLKVTVFTVLVLLISTQVAFAQDTRYVYDAAGRLIAVVDSQGRIAIYDYDEVGNLKAIRRQESNEAVSITLVTPAIGLAGTLVEIFGTGFGSVPASNQLTFNGVPTPVLTATPVRLTATVPFGATTGLVRVTTPTGQASSPEPFKVPGISLVPPQALVGFSKSLQFNAAISEIGDQRAVWSVNNVVGGSPVLGTITGTGLYTAPPDPPIPPFVQVEARSVAFPQLVATSAVSITPPSTSVVALPSDVRVVRPGIGDAGGLATNVTAATPAFVTIVRPGTGDAEGLSLNVTLAAPHFITVVRTGLGDAGGLTPNVTVARPPSITAVRTGSGEAGGLIPNVTVARPASVTVVRTGTGDPGALSPNVVVAMPPAVTVVAPGTGAASGIAPNVTVAQPPDISVTRP